MQEKKDIKTEEDVKFMVDSFYDKVNQDKLLSYVFNDFSKVDWESHLLKMYRFWNTMIFGAGTYTGNPFEKHIPLPVEKAHFDRWVSIFYKNIDEHFEGETAEDVKTRAKSIAYVFQSKLEFFNRTR